MFECPKCSAQYPKWQGRCTECGNWGTIEIENDIKRNGTTPTISGKKSDLIDLSSVSNKAISRIKTGISELDLVFGSGIVPGSITLLSGEPGIGKSTIVMQIACYADLKKDEFILYCSGEETKEQVKDRFDRISNKKNTNLKFLSNTIVEDIVTTAIIERPALLIIDSIQTIHSNEIENTLGSVNQIKACTSKLLSFSKEYNIPVIIVGHITKDGNIGGPKMLEHMVDVVLYLEVKKYKNFRILRAIKNRFGNTDEVGIFEMKDGGLFPIDNPSEIFIRDNISDKGNVITCMMEGTRPFLVEIQALISKTVFGYPKRTVSGYSLNRLEVIITVLSKKLNVDLFNYDVYVNVVGGLNIKDTSIDLSIAAAILSNYYNKEIGSDVCIFGEVGLSAEVRSVFNIEARVKEASRLGFKKIIIPKVKKTKILDVDNVIMISTLTELEKFLR